MSSTLQGTQILFVIVSILFSFGGICLWWFFFSHFSSSDTTPKRALQLSFLSGVVAMISAYFIEQLVFNLLPANTFIYAFAATALVEESIKFIIIRKQLETHNVDQVIDGMKIGLWLGFGFAFAENILYFFHFFSAEYSLAVLGFTLFIRGILATLAHGLYGVVMGYYMSLARFHFIYRPRFLEISLITSILMHGLFNFFLLNSLGVWSVIILIISLGVVLVWYDDRHSIEVNVDTDFVTRNNPPVFATQHELEVILSKNNASMNVFDKLLKWFPTKD